MTMIKTLHKFNASSTLVYLSYLTYQAHLAKIELGKYTQSGTGVRCCKNEHANIQKQILKIIERVFKNGKTL